MKVNRQAVLEDIRGELCGLLDAADPETGWFGRMGRLIMEVDDALAVLGAGSGCSLCEAGHVPARSCDEAAALGKLGYDEKPPGYWAGRCCEPWLGGRCFLAAGHPGVHAAEVPAAQPAHSCDAELRADPAWRPNFCKPDEWKCSCGKSFVHVCDEAEGCGYEEVTP